MQDDSIIDFRLSPKLAIIWINFSGYHLARLRTVQEQLNGDCIGIELVGGYGDSDYYGLPFRDFERTGLNIITLFPDKDFHQVSTLQLSTRLLQILIEVRPKNIILPGYHRIENLVALAWTKATGRISILMTDSKKNDSKRWILKEYLKGAIVKQFNGYLVGGSAHRQYMSFLGAPDNHIFEGYDVVDNKLYFEASETARQNQNQLRVELDLPKKYFLAVCRFVSKKNLPLLLEAYRIYRENSDTAWSLVICGDGPLKAELLEIVEKKQIPNVFFPGFHKGKELGIYYGLATCFILPSIQEQWGLVVNEAMAARLPILVSNTAGCAPQLIQEGVNGFTFDPTNSTKLAELMGKMTSSEDLLADMGASSQHLIKSYSPEVFANNLLLAINAAQLAKKG